jgi:hypothetical protein
MGSMTHHYFFVVYKLKQQGYLVHQYAHLLMVVCKLAKLECEGKAAHQHLLFSNI